MIPSKLRTGQNMIMSKNYFTLSVSYVIDSSKGLSSEDFEDLRSQEKRREFLGTDMRSTLNFFKPAEFCVNVKNLKAICRNF